IIEHAGNASLYSSDPSGPLSLLQLDADSDWNADSGVTSHMTPHHHWLRNYTPKRETISSQSCISLATLASLSI
ncbi:hypothetical protein PAXINDRAFT_73331, partial [Paxillus involutus ATCC 200175]